MTESFLRSHYTPRRFLALFGSLALVASLWLMVTAPTPEAPSSETVTVQTAPDAEAVPFEEGQP